MLQHFIAKDIALGIETYEHLDVATKAALVGRLHGGTYPVAIAGHFVYDEGIDRLLIGLDLLIGTDIKHRLDT